MSIFTILTIVFVIAKLSNLIAWSWWLVFLPIIVSVSFGLLFIMIAFIVALMKD